MLRDMLRLPALLMFVLGVLLSGWVMSLAGRARARVGG